LDTFSQSLGVLSKPPKSEFYVLKSQFTAGNIRHHQL